MFVSQFLYCSFYNEFKLRVDSSSSFSLYNIVYIILISNDDDDDYDDDKELVQSCAVEEHTNMYICPYIPYIGKSQNPINDYKKRWQRQNHRSQPPPPPTTNIISPQTEGHQAVGIHRHHTTVEYQK